MAFPALTYTRYSAGQMDKLNEYKTINKPTHHVTSTVKIKSKCAYISFVFGMLGLLLYYSKE